MSEVETIEYNPHAGFQLAFSEAWEKEVFTGGEAGGGKSLLLIMEALRYVSEPGYKAVIFRRTYGDLEDLFEEARSIYPNINLVDDEGKVRLGTGAKCNESKHIFIWPNRARIMFRHLQYQKNVYSHQGKQYDFIGFDELPQFPKFMYQYLFSRLRGKNPKIKRYIRGTGNPDGEFVAWVKHRFVDSLPKNTTGWFVTVGNKDIKVKEGTFESISRRFIPCIRQENLSLMKNDPDYEAMLNQLPEATKRALKYGIWNVQDKPNQVVESAWWEASISGQYKYLHDGFYTIGCDFGHDGDDLSVEILGEGNRPYRVKSWPKTKTVHMADTLALTAGSVVHDRVMIGVDCIGPGAGVGDDIEIHHPEWANKLERCVHKDDLYKPRYKGQLVFDTLRCQMWWKFREDMEAGLPTRGPKV